MRIATVPYINGLPLTYFLQDSLLFLPPSQMAQSLLDDRVDVALMPVYSALKNGFYLYPECGLIGCDGPVESVGFFTKPFVASLVQIRSLYFDIESQTSVSLAKIILKKFFHANLEELISLSIDNKDQSDAQLLIGDKALFFTGSEGRFWDLGHLWKQNTGLGFVFACWTSKRPLTLAEQSKLMLAKEAGQERMQAILANFSEKQRPKLTRYLKQSIIYQQTPALKRGFALFQEHLHDLSL